MNRIDEDWELINLFRNLRYLRHQKGLSLHGAARQAGMDPRTLQALEAGRLPERLGLRSLFALCDLYGRAQRGVPAAGRGEKRLG